MVKGIFYCVGVGPGDPKLMTYKAAETIRSCAVAAVPDSGSGRALALETAREHLAGKRIVRCKMPMTEDAGALAASWDDNARKLAVYLENGESVAFLTVGDPSLYSTAMYIHERLKKLGYGTAIVPGVPSFCAAAASLNYGLCAGALPLSLIPANAENLPELLDMTPGGKVIMKPGRGLGRIKSLLAEKGLKAAAVERASLPDEAVFADIGDMDGEAGYFTLIIVKG